MTVSDFLHAHNLCPSDISGETCLARLMEEMEVGLRGQGNIPMLPSYLSAAGEAPKNARCCVLDAGGTNLRAAMAVFDENGICRIQNFSRVPMPGTLAPMGKDEFYAALARQVRDTCCEERIGFCFSYNVLTGRSLDGPLLAWCKEVQVPEAVGHPVGQSLKQAVGENCRGVRVLNDSVATMLGASTPATPVQVGIILGTGINVCYEERCSAIHKIGQDLRAESMIISTEVGEFDGFPKSGFDRALFAATEEPDLAHAEKQCAGGYLGDLICRVWNAAAEEGLLEKSYRHIHCPLPTVSAMLAGEETELPESGDARFIAETLIHRAAKMAAILCAGPILRCTPEGSHANLAVEGSQFDKLHGFREHFSRELALLLEPRRIGCTFIQTENACLKGAALAAFANIM